MIPPAMGGHLGDWVAQVGAVGAGAVALWLGQLLLAWRRQASDEASAKASAGLEIKKHRDGLTVQMLEMARQELAAARAEIHGLRSELVARAGEVERLRRIEWRLAAYEEAIEHIEALVAADLHGRREAAENAARLFLARMEALKLKMGSEAQAEQVLRAGKRLSERKDGE